MTRKNPRRREFLKSASAGLSVIPATTALASGKTKSDFRRIIDQSHRVREKTNSMDRWFQFLRNHNIVGHAKNATYTIPAGESTDGVSSEQIEETDLNIWISLWYNCDTDEYYAEMNWSYDNTTSSWGEDPIDGAAIGYDQTWWDLASYSISEATTTSNYVSVDEDSFDGTGPGFYVDDLSLWVNEDWDITHYCGVYLNDVGTATEDERRIQGGYAHTWDRISVSSVSGSWPAGISVTVSNETYKWETKTEQDQDTLLRVSQADADYYNCRS